MAMTKKQIAARRRRRALSTPGKVGPDVLGRLAASSAAGSQKRAVGAKVKAGTPNIQETTN